jgi:thiamine pyrophosphate-dependent acetolactate synthase large subunit-like protein
VDWSQAAASLGLRSFRARDEASLGRHVAEALDGDGPALIEAYVDPGGYGQMLQALRG